MQYDCLIPLRGDPCNPDFDWAAGGNLLQLFRLDLQDPKLRRLSQRLLALSHVLDHIAQE